MHRGLQGTLIVHVCDIICYPESGHGTLSFSVVINTPSRGFCFTDAFENEAIGKSASTADVAVLRTNLIAWGERGTRNAGRDSKSSEASKFVQSDNGRL